MSTTATTTDPSITTGDLLGALGWAMPDLDRAKLLGLQDARPIHRAPIFGHAATLYTRNTSAVREWVQRALSVLPDLWPTSIALGGSIVPLEQVSALLGWSEEQLQTARQHLRFPSTAMRTQTRPDGWTRPQPHVLTHELMPWLEALRQADPAIRRAAKATL